MNFNHLLSSHPNSALEYWFFKVNSGSVAILVDWIARRNTNQNWLRVSIHSPHKREVLSEQLVELMPKDNFLNLQRTVGHIGGIAWELEIDSGNAIIKPDIFPAGLLQMADLILVSAPLARFTGWISHGGQQYRLENAQGMISHYWGRKLSSEWWWVSANQFDKEGIAVECSFVKSSLWGTRFKTPLAYLYLCRQEKKEFITLLPGMISAKGSTENFEIKIKRFGKEPITLIGNGREYGDLGDGIVNTLVGDLEIWEGEKLLAKAEGTAGLERRYKI